MLDPLPGLHIERIDRVISIRELSMANMRAMLKSREAMETERQIDPLELIVIEDGLLLSDLLALTDLSRKELDLLTETDIAMIVAESKKENPRFFGQILGTLSRIAATNLKLAGGS